jgi:multidrug efflux system membrane fusion protein
MPRLLCFAIGPDGSFVCRVKGDSTVEIRKLALGAANAETAVVETGLAEGDLVVTSGQYRLQQGVKVKVEGGAPAARVIASQGN